mmetsp:Transcript_101861/g.287377  ORF Transcript_101861/g.287377 Transcript_101861/m.287377 type:complete len:296 (+) Transcript_101861:364-1251(+)
MWGELKDTPSMAKSLPRAGQQRLDLIFAALHARQDEVAVGLQRVGRVREGARRAANLLEHKVPVCQELRRPSADWSGRLILSIRRPCSGHRTAQRRPRRGHSLRGAREPSSRRRPSHGHHLAVFSQRLFEAGYQAFRAANFRAAPQERGLGLRPPHQGNVLASFIAMKAWLKQIVVTELSGSDEQLLLVHRDGSGRLHRHLKLPDCPVGGRHDAAQQPTQSTDVELHLLCHPFGRRLRLAADLPHGRLRKGHRCPGHRSNVAAWGGCKNLHGVRIHVLRRLGSARSRTRGSPRGQ